MANSDGGIILYGVTENGHLPGNIDPVNRQVISKEWLEHVIGNIRPRIENLIINSVTIGNSNPDVVYIVQIPKSHTAHQAMDKRYYKRHNFESVMMEHYEIVDVMNRQQHPRIELDFVEFEKNRNNNTPRNDLYDLEIRIQNTGSVNAQFVVARIELPLSMVHDLSKHGISVSRRRIAPEKVAMVDFDVTIAQTRCSRNKRLLSAHVCKIREPSAMIRSCRL